MLFDFLFVVAGLAILVFAGDALVKGAVNLSLRMGIPAVIVGLTVVAFGTSAPELLVSIKAALDGVPALALGNVIGSNTANILLVLGVPALISTVPVARSLTRDYAVMIAASLLFIALAFATPMVWWHGLILLAGLGAMLWDNYARMSAHRDAQSACDEELEGVEEGISGLRIALYLLAGIIGLPAGANLLVTGASNIAMAFGVSEAVIGLTLVAVGTSLPELATTVAAALRREAGVAMGNVIGSNVFNLLGIIGITALIRPLPVPPELLNLDLWVMLGSSLLLGIFVLSGRAINRFAGIAFLGLYAAYMIVLF